MAAAAALWVYLVDLTGSEVTNHINQSVACSPSIVLDQWKSTRVTDLVTILMFFNNNAASCKTQTSNSAQSPPDSRSYFFLPC